MEKNRFIGGHIYEGQMAKIFFAYDALTDNGESIERTPIENGELLLAEDSFANENYFLRVNNIKYGGNPGWALEMAREHNYSAKNKDTSDEHENPDDMFKPQREEQRYNIAECEILGVSRPKGFFASRTLPSVFSKVRKIEPSDFTEIMKESLGDLKIGKVRSGSDTLDLDAGIFTKLLSTHSLITARTGGGKSNTMKVLLGAMLDSAGSVSPLVFEPHGEYIQDIKKHPRANERLKIYNQDGRDSDTKIRISYKRVTVNALMNVSSQMKWTEPQERFLLDAKAVLGEEWLEKLVTMPYDEEEYYALHNKNYSTVEEFNDYAKEFLKENEEGNEDLNGKLLTQYFRGASQEQTIKATRSKLKRIVRAPYLVKEDKLDDMDDIMSTLLNGKGVLVDMASLSGLHELFLSTLLTSEIMERQRKLYMKDRSGMENGNYPVIPIILEECQRVLGKGEDTEGNIFRTVVNEGRKYLVGLIGITQQAKLMDPVVLSQMNTHIILGISDETDFDILKGRVQKSIKNLQADITQLMPGEAVISTPSSPFAVPVKIYEYNEYLKSVKKSDSVFSLSNENDFSLFDD